MSFDLFFSSYRDGQPHALPESFWRGPVAPHVASAEPGCLCLRYDDGTASDLHLSAAETDHPGAMLSRPGPHPALWAAMLTWLRQEGVVLMVPGDVPPLVGSPHSARHLPADLLATMGEPVVIERPEEILAWIELA